MNEWMMRDGLVQKVASAMDANALSPVVWIYWRQRSSSLNGLAENSGVFDTDDRVRKETLEHLSPDILKVKIISMGVLRG